MAKYIIISSLILTACSGMIPVVNSLEDIETHSAIDISVSKDAIQKQKNINVIVEIQNVSEK